MSAVARVLAPYAGSATGYFAWGWAVEALPLTRSLLLLLVLVVVAGAVGTLRWWVDNRRLGGRGQTSLLDHAVAGGRMSPDAAVETWRSRVPWLLERGRSDLAVASRLWVVAAMVAIALILVAVVVDPVTAGSYAVVPPMLLVAWQLESRGRRRRVAGLEQVLARLAAPAPPVPAAR